MSRKWTSNEKWFLDSDSKNILGDHLVRFIQGQISKICSKRLKAMLEIQKQTQSDSEFENFV